MHNSIHLQAYECTKTMCILPVYIHTHTFRKLHPLGQTCPTLSHVVRAVFATSVSPFLQRSELWAANSTLQSPEAFCIFDDIDILTPVMTFQCNPENLQEHGKM